MTADGHPVGECAQSDWCGPGSHCLCVRCVCGHPASHHDAGCCWTDAEGNESWEFDGCACLGFEADR